MVVAKPVVKAAKTKGENDTACSRLSQFELVTGLKRKEALGPAAAAPWAAFFPATGIPGQFFVK